MIVFTLISLRWMHETAAALLGGVAVFLVHYVGGKFSPSLRIIDFEEAMMEFADALQAETGIEVVRI